MRLILCNVLVLIYSVASILYPVFLSKLVDQGIVRNDDMMRNFYFMILLAISLITILTYYIKSIQFTKLGQDVSFYLKTNILSKFNEYSEGFFEQHKNGEVLSILENDIKRIENILTTNLSNIIVNMVTIVGMIIIFYFSNKLILLHIIVLLAVYVIYQRKIGEKIKKESLLISKQQGEVYSQTEEIINNYIDARSINAIDFLFNKYRECSKKYYNNELKLVRLQQMSVAGGVTVQFIGIFLVLLIGGQFVSEGIMTIGTLFSLVIYCQKIFSPILSLSNNYTQMKNVSASIKRVLMIMDGRTVNGNEVVDLNVRNSPMIRFDNISYGCGNTLLVEKFDLDIEYGDKVAILGKNGSGKSTLIKILLRIKDQYNGKIFFGNCNLDNISMNSIRKDVLYIPQNSLIFDDTLRNNILMGHEIASDYSFSDIIRLVDLEREVNGWEHGSDTMLGVTGVNLSGGQKRKISIARAFVLYPHLLILDEPTADLDFVSEAMICKNIFDAFKDRTVIVITHREKILEQCNKIFEIKHKRICVLKNIDRDIAVQ